MTGGSPPDPDILSGAGASEDTAEPVFAYMDKAVAGCTRVG